MSEKDKALGVADDAAQQPVTAELTADVTSVTDGAALLTDPHRGLRMRHVQLIAISGSIGAALFVSIGNPLVSAGPLGLLIGVSLWCTVIWAATNCLSEMTVLHPVDGGFINYAARYVDQSFGTALGWNYVITQWALICFEYSAINVILAYWFDDFNPAITISIALVLLTAINMYSVRWFGEVEFWVSVTKLFLIFMVTMYTFVTMVGGNPLHDRYGFRYWKTPGPFKGQSGVAVVRGIFDAISWGTFAIVGPDYASLIAGEVKSPRRILPKAFNSIIYRIIIFYVGGALCVGIVSAADDASLLGAISAGAPGAARSPYVISMNRLGIKGLPDLVNALVLVSIFSTTNSFVFTASRGLFSMAQDGRAPKVFMRVNKQGVPWVAVGVTLLISCISYLQVSAGAVKVLNWWINLVTSAQLVSWTCIAIISLRFRKALNVQKLTHILPMVGHLQPYSAWYVLVWSPVVLFFSGYYLFGTGLPFDGPGFVFCYGSIFIFLAILISSKTIRMLRHKKQGREGKARLGWIPAAEIDLTTGLEHIEALTQASEEKRASKPRTRGQRISDFFF